MSTERRREPLPASRIAASLRPAPQIGPEVTVADLRKQVVSPSGPTAVVITGEDDDARVVDALTVVRSTARGDDPAATIVCCRALRLTPACDLADVLAVVMDRPPSHRGHDLVFDTDDGPMLLAMSAVTAMLVEDAATIRQIDMLTGLPGRATIQTALQDALRADPTSVAVAFVDLDRFKEINDLHGHAVGDRVLQVVGRRLRHGLRKGDVVGRIGGDEFVAVLRVQDADEARRAARRLVAHIAEPVEQTPSVVRVGASVGVALVDADEADSSHAQRLIADADALMYLAKQRGGGVLVAGDVDDVVVTRSQLSEAMERGRLELQYQPIVPLDGSIPTAVEALVRWPRDGNSTLQPSAFVPLAEATGQIVDLDWWVLQSAIDQLTRWDNSQRLTPTSVNVNLSALTLAMPGLVSHVERVLSIAGIDPHRLTLEITETAVVADTARARDVLTALHALGVRTAIDDFGIGQSSLAQLSQLDVSALKIDRAFVQRLTHREVDRSVVRVVRALADELGLDVVAEGVESLDQARALSDLGVTHAQGWLWAPALDAATLGDGDRPDPVLTHARDSSVLPPPPPQSGVGREGHTADPDPRIDWNRHTTP